MQTLRNQILVVIVGLVLLTATTILGVFWLNMGKYTRNRVDSNFQAATQTFKQQLKSRQIQLFNSAELLTSDFGFKQAIASRDTPTIKSALINYKSRAHADMMFLTDLSGNVTASTLSAIPAKTPFPVSSLIKDAEQRGAAVSTIRLDGSLYQVVLVPVRAPRPIALAGIGFKLDRSVASELKSLSGLDVTFVVTGNKVVASTLPEADLDAALSAPNTVSHWFGVPFATVSLFVTRHLSIEGVGHNLVQLVLTDSLRNATGQFDRLRRETLYLALIILALAFVCSALLARNMSRPLNRLVAAATAIARGEFQPDVSSRNDTHEISTLFHAFNKMGHGIKEREARITWQAQHDDITGLLTRNRLIERLDEQIRAGTYPFIVAIFTVPDITNISDAFGPAVSDEYLKGMAQRLISNLNEEALCARTGTVEFAYVQPIHGDIAEMTHVLTHQLQQPLWTGDLNVKPEVILGYARFPLQGAAATDLLRRSSIALDHARRQQVAIRGYREGEEEEHLQHLRLTNDLKDALLLDNGQLYMCYQPKLHLDSGRIDKLEALIRWQHPEKGFVSPELFVALAERSNLIEQLTDWVIDTVVQQSSKWFPTFPNLQIAINVSARDLEREELLPQVKHLLAEYELPHGAIAFEMTERDMMCNAENTIERISRFKEYGFDLSVDDYGIGYSSLSKLKKMPVTEIKIDKSFVMQLDQSVQDQIIVRSTIELGHSFGLKVVAEGVENAKAQAMLKAWGCDYIQGYHLSRPLAPERIAEWIHRFNERRVVVRL